MMCCPFETKEYKMVVNRIIRKIHIRTSIIIAVPLIIIASAGIMLSLKKVSSWIQPPMIKGIEKYPCISFNRILTSARNAPEAGIKSWDDIDRLDVRIGKGVVKVQSRNHWEVQIDTKTGRILQVAYRRSDILETIHDCSWLHEYAKLCLLFPAGLFTLVSIVTGIWLFLMRLRSKHTKRAID